MVSSLDILAKIRDYLGGQLDLHQFREWMVESHLEIQGHKAKNEPIDPDAAQLLADLEGRYAEFSDKLVSEADWRKRVVALVLPIPKSAESYFLNYFYMVPSTAFQLNSLNISTAYQETGNPLNSASTYRDPEEVAA